MFTFVLTTALVAFVTQSQPALPKAGAPAPAFAFSDVIVPEGKPAVAASELTPERLKGKVVVLDFFATWCAPCVEAIPHTNALIASTTDLPVVYLGVTDQTREVLTDFVKGRPFEAIVAFDREKTTFTNYFISGLPLVVIIDTEGPSAIPPPSAHAGQASADLLEVLGSHESRAVDGVDPLRLEP